ncbi:predicted protein [Chaetomium globosum CBS 148.51]|uniref:Uncharacterized protein n=1 Tax=Chaetomium globosum (strain ATCC 6205 / CBS 148.51 / DSM 1962 / NBRC 6347 / NRRL 1970) TaxID=306901 RepID=Q2GTE4_CHAGB|nr:uncharacterized protein CHGG_08760 [Chaetomium globosum CBS 148.51]EAQ84746.1 predicted protein [Chaetomium globosum CBS 148.51]
MLHLQRGGLFGSAVDLARDIIPGLCGSNFSTRSLPPGFVQTCWDS